MQAAVYADTMMTVEQMKVAVVDAMKDHLRFKTFVSRDEISASIEPLGMLKHLEPTLNRLMNEAVIVSAHDNHHFFFV